MRPALKKALLSILTASIVALLVAMSYVHYRLSAPVSEAGTFEVRPGEAASIAAARLGREGRISMSPILLKLATKLTNGGGVIKAGEYDLASGLSAYQLIAKLQQGRVRKYSVTFPEGWRLADWRRVLDAHPMLVHRTTGMTEAALAEALAIDGHLEGWFFPNTYHFAKGDSDLAVLRQAHLLMREQLERLWAPFWPPLYMDTPYKALILASIIEKETGYEADRRLIASVFHNRLESGMRLQSDPTVIYGLGDAFIGNLTKRHLRTDNAYNTYTRTGLPPSPVCMPGLESLKAAFEPAYSNYLYFVAKGNGESHFSETLAEHNRAVDRYQRGGNVPDVE